MHTLLRYNLPPFSETSFLIFKNRRKPELLMNGMHSEDAIPELDGFDLDLNDLQLEEAPAEGGLSLDLEDF